MIFPLKPLFIVDLYHNPVVMSMAMPAWGLESVHAEHLSEAFEDLGVSQGGLGDGKLRDCTEDLHANVMRNDWNTHFTWRFPYSEITE